jgi:preprotein translocase subunit SecA
MDRMGAQEGEVLTHPLITRSIESAQKRVELQNFQSRKRLLEYDDVMNQQREVIYSLRSFALEGGEELKSEALKMVEKAVARRVETVLADAAPVEADGPLEFGVLQQELLMHYLLPVPALADDGALPTSPADAGAAATEAARAAFAAKIESFEPYGPGLGDHLLAQVMLHVLDEKWKDHLYDLDQLRGAIHYRSWGQKDPLIEYKQEAYTMFVDLMNDIYHTFSERFFHVQLVFDEPAPPMDDAGPNGANGNGGGRIEVVSEPPRHRPTKRYNALGILEDIPPEELFAAEHDADSTADDDGGSAGGLLGAVEIGPDETPNDGDVLARPARSA